MEIIELTPDEVVAISNLVNVASEFIWPDDEPLVNVVKKKLHREVKKIEWKIT